MREIKFRVYWDNAFYRLKGIDFQNGICQLNGADIINKKDAVIEQFTGLKDKNGVEIYEGDKIKYATDSDLYLDSDGNVYVDEWIESTVSWQNSYPAFDIDNHTIEYNLLSSPEIIIEVIGNIHEEKKNENKKTT